MAANPWDELWDAVESIEARLDALEAAVGQETARADDLAENEKAREDELAKLAWAAKHGRQRPW